MVILRAILLLKEYKSDKRKICSIACISGIGDKTMLYR